MKKTLCCGSTFEGAVALDEAYEWLDCALDRIADDHDMDLARQGVQVYLDEETEEL